MYYFNAKISNTVNIIIATYITLLYIAIIISFFLLTFESKKMLKLNPLKKYLTDNVISTLEKDNLFQELATDVISDIKNKSGIDLQTSEPTLDMLKPLADIFAYLAIWKNVDMIPDTLISSYKANYNAGISYFIDNRIIESNTTASELVITGRIHSQYGLR